MKRDNPALFLFSKTWKYSAGNRKNVVLYWVMFLVANAIALLSPLLVGRVMNIVQTQGVTTGNIWQLLGLISLTLVITIAFWALHGPARVIEADNAFKVRANYKKYLFHGVMSLPIEWQTNHHSGNTMDKIEKGTGALYSFSEDSFQIIQSIVELSVSYFVLVYFNVHSSYIVLIMIAITTWIIMRFDRVLVRQYRELNHAENDISERIYDVVSNVTTIIILRVEKFVFKAISKRIDKPYELFHESRKLNETKWFLVSFCSRVMVIAVLTIYLVSNVGTVQGVLVGNFFILWSYLDKISELFYRFADMYGNLLQRKTRVMNAEELAEDFQSKPDLDEAVLNHWYRMEVKNLAFSYHTEEGADLHLDDISFSVKRGERIALVGESGSGKTTLLKIIRDLYHPRSLDLFVDGMLVAGGFKAISSTIALVPQDPEIFSTTILENITLGVEHEMGDVRRFTDMARFTEVVERLPKKFDSSIVEKGVNLSGGEKQRLALARGLMACEDKSVILLDEPTSSIDLVNEMQIHKNIFGGFTDKTIISSVHRLHLLPLFDRIYFFTDGKISCSGTLSELIAESEEFRTLWMHYSESKLTN